METERRPGRGRCLSSLLYHPTLLSSAAPVRSSPSVLFKKCRERSFLDRCLVVWMPTCSAGCLIRTDYHSLDTRFLVQWCDTHQRNDGGAVGIGNDPRSSQFVRSHVLFVHLRDNQRHAFCHSEGGTVVHYLNRQKVTRDPHCSIKGRLPCNRHWRRSGQIFC